MRTWEIASWALAALLFNASCLAAVGQPAGDGGDAGSNPAGCGGGVACSAGETCDPIDNRCKCGPELSADGGVGLAFCGPNESCSPTLGVCVGNFCDMKVCSNGNICDLADGVCKCGGRICQPTETCDTRTHLCQ